jgi:lipopolysaccharide transport system ATP-binding protein
MADVVIAVENLSKRYLVGHRSSQHGHHDTTLRDVIVREARNFTRKAVDLVRGRQIVQGDEIEEFWALKNVTFEVKQGEIVGIIGRNGAGKSTLLKILSRITEPTDGRVLLRGRVASLLEVGTGFHQELTGRENIFLNGAVLGMKQWEIRKKFDEIVAFSEVEKFLDTPVKRYSSGMYVRLAFAVAAHLEPEILIIDEVLAVGDAEFQKKCLGKMSEVARGGRTILFVSHNHAAIRGFCTHGLLLCGGKALPKKDVLSVLDEYTFERQASVLPRWSRPQNLDQPVVHFDSVDARIEGSQPNLRLVCNISIRSKGTQKVFIAVDVLARGSSVIMQAEPKSEPFIGGEPGLFLAELSVELPPLTPGTYELDFWIGSHNTETLDYINRAVMFEVFDYPSSGRTYPYHPEQHGHIVPKSSIRVFKASLVEAK